MKITVLIPLVIVIISSLNIIAMDILSLKKLCLLKIQSTKAGCLINQLPLSKSFLSVATYENVLETTDPKKVGDIIKGAQLARNLVILERVESLERSLTHAKMQLSSSPTEKREFLSYFQSLSVNDQTRICGYEHDYKTKAAHQ